MAKYFITFVLLLCLALENDNIYNRLHARSHPNIRESAVRSHPKHQPHQHVQHTSQQLQQQHHIRQQRSRQLNQVEPDPANSEEEGEQQQQQHYYERMRRHLLQQQEHMLKQEHSYHREAPQELKNVPRLWQLLSEASNTQSDEMDYPPMFGDAPMPSNEDLNLNPLDYAKSELQERLVEVPEEVQMEKELPPVNATKSSGGCPKCESNRQVEHITEEELTRLRIEFVKQQILEKLRLKESPNVSAVELPKPIFEGVTLSHGDESSKNKELDDYYARTSKKFILLKREEIECKRLGASPSMCFSFKIDDADADGFDVNNAVLWLFKNKQNLSTTPNINDTLPHKQQTIVVSEVEQQLDSKYLPLAKTIAIQEVDVQDEWMKIDIEWPIKRWFGNHDLSHLIQITCESCDNNSMDEMISVDKDYRPFIMIDTQNRRSKSRQKRSINCSSGVTECCREKLYISFAEIGWNNWILRPEGYDAYFCRGSCSSVASAAQAASHHSSLMKILSTNGTRKPLELVPCCTAKQYSSLQLVVMDSNNSATVKTLPNMVVESCGCR